MEEKAQFSHAPHMMLVGAFVLSLAVNFNKSLVGNRSTIVNIIVTLGFVMAWLCFSISNKQKNWSVIGLIFSGLTFLSVLVSFISAHVGLVISSFVPYVIVYSCITPFYRLSSMTNANWNTYYIIVLLISLTMLVVGFIRKKKQAN